MTLLQIYIYYIYLYILFIYVIFCVVAVVIVVVAVFVVAVVIVVVCVCFFCVCFFLGGGSANLYLEAEHSLLFIYLFIILFGGREGEGNVKHFS